MKKWFWILGIFALITVICVCTLSYINKYPTLLGNEVFDVRIFDSQYNLIARWTIDPKSKWLTDSDKKKRKTIQQILQPFNERQLVDSKTGKPNYWFRIDSIKRNGFNYLVWLREGAPAGFVESTEVPRSFENTEYLTGNQYFSISEQQQKQMLDFLKSKKTNSNP